MLNFKIPKGAKIYDCVLRKYIIAKKTYTVKATQYVAPVGGKTYMYPGHISWLGKNKHIKYAKLDQLGLKC